MEKARRLDFSSREQVESILVNLKEKPDVEKFLVEFEMELIKYENKVAANQESGKNEKTRNKYLSDPGARINFRGMISSCFEPHLTIYIEKKEKELIQLLEKVVQVETWNIEDESQNNILSSSIQVQSRNSILPTNLEHCLNLFKNQLVFQLVLKAYATKLTFKLPKGDTSIVAAATGMDGQIKVSDRDERMICYIVNSAEYFHKTSGELAKEVSTIIDPHYAYGVDMSEVQDEFDTKMVDMT